MKLSRIDLFWGVALVIVGIGFGGEALGLWNFELFFNGWWTLFIIVPSLLNLFESGMKRSNTIGVTIGVLLLLSSWHVIADDFSHANFINCYRCGFNFYSPVDREWGLIQREFKGSS